MLTLFNLTENGLSINLQDYFGKYVYPDKLEIIAGITNENEFAIFIKDCVLETEFRMIFVPKQPVFVLAPSSYQLSKFNNILDLKEKEEYAWEVLTEEIGHSEMIFLTCSLINKKYLKLKTRSK